MLQFSSQLLFPTLRIISSPSISANLKHNLYQLDWESTESIKEKKWTKTRLCSPSDDFPGSLPNPLRKNGLYADTLQFTIPQNLLDEIRYCSSKSLEEWSRKKPDLRWEPIPTAPPTAVYMLTAFNILTDCSYDPNTNNFSRDPLKILLPYALSYQFWCHQIKPDLLKLYSGIQEMQNNFNLFSSINQFATSFIEGIDRHIEMIKKDNKKEVGYAHEITSGNLKDFLQNKRASVRTENTTIEIPGFKKITLIEPILSRSSKGIKLSSELSGLNDAKTVLDILQENPDISFSIKDSSCTVKISDAKIEDLSGTPPPIISIKIVKLVIIYDKSIVESDSAYSDYRVVGQVTKKKTASEILDDLLNTRSQKIK